MLYLFGGLMEDVSYYHKAWELSGETYYHAMNGLARYYLREK